MRNSIVLSVLWTITSTISAQNATTNGTMRRVAYTGTAFNVSVETAAMPQLQEPGDVIVRVTTAALCGTDLHSYRGFTSANPSGDIGHEAVGVIEAIGAGVSTLSVGDYVVIPASGTYGGVQLAPSNRISVASGLQAEYGLISWADENLIPLPLTSNTTNSSIERDYLLVGDIWSTAWQGLTWSNFEPGETVAVWGAGPVGLLAAYSAQLRGASKVFIIDRVQQRLDKAQSFGAIPINFETQNITEIIQSEAPGGVMRQVECVGFEAFDPSLAHNPSYIWNQMLAIAHYGGGIGFPGLWYHNSVATPLAPRADLVPANVSIPYNQFWLNRVSLSGGTVVPTQTAGHLINLINSGVARGIADLIMTAEIGLEEVPDYYARFERWEEIKVFIKFS